jgi:hypothetical protein
MVFLVNVSVAGEILQLVNPYVRPRMSVIRSRFCRTIPISAWPGGNIVEKNTFPIGWRWIPIGSMLHVLPKSMQWSEEQGNEFMT